MGERGGFLKYHRVDTLERPVKKRIKDWNEFYVRQTDESIKRQAARCMECGTPFCHTGDILGGMVSGCPLHNLIPEWNDLVYKGLWKEAYMRLCKTTDFPEFTGRVCPALCEGSCTAGLNGDPVTIRNNEKEIAEKAFYEGWVMPDPPLTRNGRKVAVIGSGPSGLTCANQLNKLGYEVAVYEREDRPGGLLMYGIPNMKLDKEKVVLRRIDLMEKEGIRFITGMDVGRDISPQDLLDEYDAVVLCTGSTRPRDLDIKGRGLEGIFFAVDFLKKNTKCLLAGSVGEMEKSVKGSHVAVIGGGDTGTDCVAASIRLGCKSVIQLEIMPRPPLGRQADNPWPEWPRTFKVGYGHEEAAELFGDDPRHYLTSALSFSGNGKGRVRSVTVADVEWMTDRNGKAVPKGIPGSGRELQADIVLLAMGFLGPEDYIFDTFSVGRDIRNNIRTIPGSFMTDVKGVFAAGDARRGPSLVVWAMQEGRKAALEINEYLNPQG